MQELQEKDFIREQKGKNPVPIWIGMAGLLALLGIIWIGGIWFYQQRREKVDQSPFLRVTNRAYSLFLWQHTEYMRPHMKEKTGYLPGFRPAPMVTPQGDQAEEWVAAPPELLFEYHTWKRLLGDYVFPTPISSSDLRKFLESAEEWQPKFWKKAPFEYRKTVEELETVQIEDLNISLPKEVRQAFIGWKNYFQEGESINYYVPTVRDIRLLIEKYPHYKRHYWRNLYPEYLKSFQENDNPEKNLPPEEIPPFLKVALYNFTSATKPSS